MTCKNLAFEIWFCDKNLGKYCDEIGIKINFRENGRIFGKERL